MWLVARDDGRALGCGGLREAGPGVGEAKRMFVTADARGRGVGRLLLAELERRARGGHRRMRLYTTEVLVEARGLYARCGYRPVGVAATADGRLDLWLEKRLRAATSARAR